MIEGELPFNPASVAVADAMMVAQVRLLDNDEYFYAGNGARLSRKKRMAHREKQTEELTYLECWIAVRTVMHHLAKKHSDKFSAILGIVADKRMGNFSIRWGRHYNFLAEDIYGIWYAGSPANYRTDDVVNRLTTPIISSDLQTVLSGIKRRDGGVWPSPTAIQDFTSYPTGSIPIPVSLQAEGREKLVGTLIEKVGANDHAYSPFELFPI